MLSTHPWWTDRIRPAVGRLVRGAPAPIVAVPARQKAPAPSVHAGRWVRVTHSEPVGEQPFDREVSDPAEAAAVRAGWLLIDAYERLSSKAAARVFGHEIDAWNAYAADTIGDLVSPDGRIMVDVEQSPTNRLRYRRTMDFAQKGDRVFDVGFGRGYLAAQLIRERGVVGYHGIDIIDTWVDDSHRLLEANGLAGADIVLEQGDLFDLTKEQVSASGADLVICCEVLEHVDDAEKALRVLADALPDGADLLFSVPLHGRLEQVWGHTTVFDVARLKQMLDGAGLHAHHVEPLANTWSLVVASRDPDASARVRDASRRPAVRASVPLVTERRFVDLGPDDLVALPGPGATTTSGAPDGRHVTCSVTTRGGVRFPVRGLESLRLSLLFTACDDLSRLEVVARSGQQEMASWSWTPGAKHPATGQRRVWFRAGEASAGFRAGPHGSMLDIDSVEVVAKVTAGRTVTFGLAAAYLP
jgi:2-polyprenyl-3-methyl-5-hydroxy-6-metoxy-1,4-benzoquinol methylase